MARHKAGDLKGAIARYQDVLGKDRDNATALHYMGLAVAQSGDSATAERHVVEAAKLQPEASLIWANLGKIRIAMKNFDGALEAFRRAVALDAEDYASWNNIGGLLQERGEGEAALSAFQSAYSLKEHPKTAMNIAALLKAMNRSEEALTYYKAASSLKPDLVEARIQIAAALTELGRFDDAEGALKTALQNHPHHARLLAALLTLKSYAPEDEKVAAAEALLQNGALTDEDRARLGFALGRAYERLKDYDAAFDCAEAANAIVARTTPFDAGSLSREVDILEEVFTEAFFADRADLGVASERPVFVVGMPRTGTTLTEQILASHPDAAGAGELSDIARLPGRIMADLPGGRYPAVLAKASKENISAWAEVYLKRLEEASPNALRVVDKFPFNFSHIGLIALMFPKARIIHCRRDPRDVFVSCFFTEFTDVLQAFRTSPENFTAYYQLYERIMTLWDRVLPGRIFHLQYEDMVESFDERARALVDHCGLPWDDRCASFYQTDRAVRTPSRWQVRQPIYATSVGRWRRYENRLAAVSALRS